MKDQVPLRDDDLLLLRGPKTFDPQELTRALEPLGFKAFLSTRFAIVEDELKQLLVEEGISYVWRLVRLQEAVLPPGPTDRPGLLKLLDGMIAKLAPRREFAVVDAYLLSANTPPGYLAEVLSLLEPIARGVTRLVLITSGRYDAQLLQDLETSLAASCPSCQLIHKVSNRYHDRFWIADQARALFVGTSLNGIGRRYAIADYMVEADVIEVVSDLKANGLL
jgi:hypothetical protein